MAGLSQDRTFYAQDRIIIRGSSENPAEEDLLHVPEATFPAFEHKHVQTRR